MYRYYNSLVFILVLVYRLQERVPRWTRTAAGTYRYRDTVSEKDFNFAFAPTHHSSAIMADGRKAVLSFQSLDDQTLLQYLPDLAAQENLT